MGESDQILTFRATWTYFDVTRISGTTFFLEMSQTASSSETCQPDSTTTWNHQVGFAGISSNFARSHLDGQKSFNASCLLRSCRQCALEIASMEVPGVKMKNGRPRPFAEKLCTMPASEISLAADSSTVQLLILPDSLGPCARLTKMLHCCHCFQIPISCMEHLTWIPPSWSPPSMFHFCFDIPLLHLTGQR